MKNDEKNIRKNSHAGHRKRMFEKFHASQYNLPEHELLELLLCYSIRRQNTNVYAHDLLDYFGSFHEVFEAEYENLQKVTGIGPSSANLIKLLYSCFRCFEASLSKSEKIIRTKEDAGKFFVEKLKYETQETPMVLLLNNRDGIIVCKPFGQGNVNYSPDCIRQLFTHILTHNTAGIYIAHNHPNGIAIPSNDDLDLSIRIREICYDMKVDFKDHIIVAGDDYCSVMEYLDKRR